MKEVEKKKKIRYKENKKDAILLFPDRQRERTDRP
jgi:hypothetical protein